MRDNLDNSVNSSAASPAQREYRAEPHNAEGVTTMLTVEMPLADPGRDLPRKI